MNLKFRAYLLLIILLFFLSASCEIPKKAMPIKIDEDDLLHDLIDDANEENEPSETEDDNPTIVDPIEDDADDSTVNILKIEDVLLDEIPLMIAKRMQEMNDYEAHTIGKTVAKLLITYNQEIDSTKAIHNGVYYLKTISNSLLVKLYHEAIISKNEVNYKTKASDDFSILSYKEYVNKFGNHPYSLNIEGFTITNESIIYIKDLSTTDENIYEISLDGNICGTFNKIQMKEYGNLSDYPTYESVVLKLYIKDDFTPLKIELEAIYNAPYPVLGNAKCTQKYTVTFSDISETNKEIIEKQMLN